MTEFARTAAAVQRADPTGTTLVTEAKLNELYIAQGHPIGKWISNPKNQAAWVLLLKLRTKSPFKAGLPDGVDGYDVEYRHGGLLVDGLGAAHMTGGLGISLPVDAHWDATTLTLERERLVDEDESEEGSGTEADLVDVRHVSTVPHVDDHLRWIKTSLDTAATTGAQLWEKRDRICPSLQFLPEVENHLRKLAPASVAVVRRRLTELEEAVTGWDPDARPRPQWRGDVRGEFESRKHLCRFTDLDGEQRLFYLHTDYPPKPGRIHFRLVPEDRTVRVAYVGRKLGA
ncbi:hypothetical protein [Streptomyces adelaidensis]|uniref:hypothetical protein n=1 Tax=Streptomyces adelaidensis TaxID=2796465 RepID=UPI00190335F2|nr:hypothetical protein [Streptomyces adelaidensis]